MDEVNHTLQRIARGAGIVFAGTIISMLFSFLSVAVIARFFSRAEYGVFSLSLILSVAPVMATMVLYEILLKQLLNRVIFILSWR